MGEFRMPSLGADMAAGRLVAWRCKPGDLVRRGDIVAEVETDKGVVEVEVFATGVVERLLVEPDADVPVGTPLAIIAEEPAALGLAAAAAPREAPGAAPPAAPAPPLRPREPAPAPAHVPAPAPPAAPPRASPAARQRARALGIDLGRVQGTGRGGAIGLEDVERAAAAAGPPIEPRPPAPPAAAAPAPPSDATARMRRAIGAVMSRSKREVPHFYVGTTIDLGPAAALLAERNLRVPVAERVLPAVLLLKAAALALREVPELNARWEGDHATVQPDIHLSVAIWLRGGGLVAPAVRNADRLELGALMAALRDLSERARRGGLRASELTEGTFTVTSLGDRGSESVQPIIFTPQVGILGLGRIAERPWVVAGRVVPRPLVHASLAADHRAVDGHRAGVYLAALESLLAAPEQLATPEKSA